MIVWIKLQDLEDIQIQFKERENVLVAKKMD
jgi:hypothetical protein